ncbi:MAG: hypothetical protein ACOYYF_16195 [Chloroflexota bacterium]|nr:hypothetical protein [Chloroflexota bacterium]MBI5703912.1 hypothetical protein [Chloroflexota bacterium]
MTDNTGEDFITNKHGRLMNIASAANIFAWIALVSQVLYVGARFIQFQSLYMTQTMPTRFGQPNFMEMLSQNPVYTFSLIVDLASILIRGIIYWLVLKGVSLGLYMIVETDLNYKDKLEGVTNE